MLIREGNKIKVLLGKAYEAEDKNTEGKVDVKDSDIKSILRKIVSDLRSEIASDIKPENESYSSNEIFGFSNKEKVEKWLSDITLKIQDLLKANNFYDSKPIYTGGCYIFPFGIIDDDGRLESSTISVINNYLTVVKKIPSVIESSDKANRENTNNKNIVDKAIRKHVSVAKNQFMLFFSITRVDTSDSDNVGLTLGVYSTKENMKGATGSSIGSTRSGETLYRYDLSSVYVNLDKVVELELDVPKYLEKLLQLRNKAKLKGKSKVGARPTKIKSFSTNVKGLLNRKKDKTKTTKTDRSKSKMNALLKEIEDKGINSFTENQLQNISDELIDYIVDLGYFDKLSQDQRDFISSNNNSGKYSDPIDYFSMLKQVIKGTIPTSKKSSDVTKVSSPDKNSEKKPKDDTTVVSSPSKRTSGNDAKTVVSK